MLRPTPMRPLSYHEGDQGSPCEGAKDLTRRGSLKVMAAGGGSSYTLQLITGAIAALCTLIKYSVCGF